MNTYEKFAPTVFVAKCKDPHQKGEIITLTSKYGNETDVVIHNLVKQDNEFFYYSFVAMGKIAKVMRLLKQSDISNIQIMQCNVVSNIGKPQMKAETFSL